MSTSDRLYIACWGQATGEVPSSKIMRKQILLLEKEERKPPPTKRKFLKLKEYWVSFYAFASTFDRKCGIVTKRRRLFEKRRSRISDKTDKRDLVHKTGDVAPLS